MQLYIERETPGVYGLVDTFINETITLNTKTLFTQDITAVFKGFTNSFSVKASPNNIKLLGYFGYTDKLVATPIKKRSKLYLDGLLFREGIITLETTSYVNERPSLFQLSFSDGQRNLTEILGEDKLSSLDDGDIIWSTKNIQKAFTSIQNSTGGYRWFIPLVSTERIFTIDNQTGVNQTDNLHFIISKPITSENVLLEREIRPAMFISDILKAINKKYDIKIDPTPFVNDVTQLTDLATMCMNSISVKEVKAQIEKTTFDYDAFVENRFDIIPKPLIDAFEIKYIGGSGPATFDMIIQLSKTTSNLTGSGIFTTINYGTPANATFIYGVDVWEVDAIGNKKKKLNYQIQEGGESANSRLRIRIGLDVFTPEGSNAPSTLVKPLIAIFVSADKLSEWRFTNVTFNWDKEFKFKTVLNNVQPISTPTIVNLFQSLADIKTIDFVKSIYTMFGYKIFKTKTINDFYYKQKETGIGTHRLIRNENDLTPYADLSKFTKQVNTKYDGYDLKHFTSEYQQNVAFTLANGLEYGQLKYPLTGKPKTEFKIETKFTAPVFNPITTNADTQVFTFYPFGSTPKLNDLETRFIFDTNIKEFPIFYYNGVAPISTTYAYVDTDTNGLKSINRYHKISHRSNKIKTGDSNFITSLFNIITGDFIDQNTLYVQAYKEYIEDTIEGKKLIHKIDLSLPNVEIQKFDDSDEIIIKETKYTVLESNISLTDGKTKLTLLNK